MDPVTQRPPVWQRRWRYHDRRSPSRNCRVICQTLLLAGLLRSGPTQANAGDPGGPSHPTPSPVGGAGRGEMLYKASCMVCHGSEAAGLLDRASQAIRFSPMTKPSRRSFGKGAR
jgi:hypothetical protein